MCMACVQDPTFLLDDFITVQRFLKRKSKDELNKLEASTIKETMQTLVESGGEQCDRGQAALKSLRERQYKLSQQL